MNFLVLLLSIKQLQTKSFWHLTQSWLTQSGYALQELKNREKEFTKSNHDESAKRDT